MEPSSLVESLYARGRAAYPELAVECADFATHLSRCASRSPWSPRAESELLAEDLYLACACFKRSAGAAESFRRQFRVLIRSALAALSRSAAFRDEVEQQVYEEVLFGGPDILPKIGSYTGQGPLARWVTVVAQRAGLMALRADAVEGRARDKAALDRFDPVIHAEVAFLKSKYRPIVDQALADAVALLPDRDRVVLHLNLVGGAGVQEIGKMYGVSASTASRWLTQARTSIASEVRRLLRARLQLAAQEIDSLVALVSSQLDVSLGGLLLR